MLSIKITSIEKASSIPDGTRYLDVGFDILDEDEKVVASRKLAFPLDMETKIIKDELKRYLKNYESELKSAEKQAEIDKQDKAADKTISQLEGEIL